MMVIVVAVTSAAIYVGENNVRANHQKLRDNQFQNQLRSFLAAQDLQSNAMAEKCRAVSRSVRLRAALAENDVDDLYENALMELQDIFNPNESSDAHPGDSMHASFFRFLDRDGAVLSPGSHPAGLTAQPLLQGTLPSAGRLRHVPDEQSVCFIAIENGSRPSALREVVLTKIREWDGREIGGLLLGFPLKELRTEQSQPDAAIKSGIWLNRQLYMRGLSAADRHLLIERVSAVINKSAGNFTVDLAIGPYLLFYKMLDARAQFAPAYQVCLYPLAESLREERALRWKLIAFGFVVLACGFAASLFLSGNLSKPVDKIVAGSIENLTLRKQAEKNLLQANRELEKALSELKATQQQVIQQERLSALGQMAAGIAHDFNNTLMPILGFADVLLENKTLFDDKAEARRCLEMLRTSAKDAASVVSRLREFYRPAESNEEFSIVDLAKIIEQAVALTEPKWRGLTQASGITIEVSTEFKALPMVSGEETALREMLTNLLFNAVDAMPDGGRICIETSLDNDRAVIRVTDSGTGMTESVRQRCLEPFFSTKGERGTGLGLSMVYGIVERHRGQVEIQSTVGKGTTFIIRLPLAEDAPSGNGATAEVIRPNSSLKVLIVDDEARSREVLSVYLRCDEHSVTTASSGREALEKFRRRHFDLVMMDRAMPQMSGDQTARFMKQVRPDTPIILLTGFAGSTDATSAPGNGIDLVLHKPITLDVLRRAIEKLLRYAA
jgi:signal transduction histidine kinase/CheY-like chemotaxis protein